MLKIGLVTPAPPGSSRGNAVTAARWTRILEGLGHRVSLVQVPYEPGDEEPELPSVDLLVALHARRSAPAVRAYRRRQPEAPLIVALTGTDLYADLATSGAAQATAAAADRLIVLQERGVEALPADLRRKARVIHQGVASDGVRPKPPPADVFRVVLLANLRAVKDPLLGARALSGLPASSTIQLLHLGEPLDAALAEAARAESAVNPRYEWDGSLPRAEALSILAGSSLCLLTSRLEGGANAMGEALALGVPVLSTDVEGSLGLLGSDYPGLFPVGDALALTELLRRAESEPEFCTSLREACARRRHLVEPARERAAWAALLGEFA